MNLAIKILILILCVDVVFFVVSTGTESINPTGPIHLSSSFIDDADTSDGSYVLNTNPALSLPDTEASVNTEGNLFTDIFGAVKNWLLDSTGLSYLLKMTGGPYTYLQEANNADNNCDGVSDEVLPKEFIFAIGAIWYLLTLLAIILLIAGRL